MLSMIHQYFHMHFYLTCVKHQIYIVNTNMKHGVWFPQTRTEDFPLRELNMSKVKRKVIIKNNKVNSAR